MVIKKRVLVALALVFLLVASSIGVGAAGKTVMLATTTSVNDSGLMDYLRPVFEKDTGYQLKIISQGTGQALKTGRDGNADVLLIHDPTAEEKFVAEGFGVKRIELAYNYFIMVGPKNDVAGILKAERLQNHASLALQQIATSQAPFISRGDESGTHKKELALWNLAKVKPAGDWYIAAGKGMGDVLMMASEKQAYTLTDKATFLAMRAKLDLQIVVGTSPELLNQYSVIKVNPAKHPKVNRVGADRFVKWITGKKALQMINNFGKAQYQEGLFIVNYRKR